jgi:uncharacterized protein (TIGR03086 family)
MSETAERWRTVADDFTERVRAVPDDAWTRPAPCEGWDARDVVRHLVEWIPSWVRDRAGVDLPAGPSVDDDPVGAWQAVDDGVRRVLDDPELAGREADTPMGRTSVEKLLAMAGVSDVLIHTWDLARAAGLDERLDPGEVSRVLAGMSAVDEDIKGPSPPASRTRTRSSPSTSSPPRKPSPGCSVPRANPSTA